MAIPLQVYTSVKIQNPPAALATGVAWGFVGGLVATLSMDMVLMAALSALGVPPLTCFSIVGDTAARFFSVLSLAMAGGVIPGIATHYLIGPLVGAVFGTAVAQIGALRSCSLKKVILLAVLFVEILAQPILATTPILLKMTAAETLQWFGGSFVMHFIFGVVLGVFLSYGMRMSLAANHRSFRTKPGLNYSPQARKM
jgi:hypothetical protein